jgi:4-hydroxy-tetrahydrodipicolinate synthase
MNPGDSRNRIRGLVVPLVTPFDANGALDIHALHATAEHALHNGAQGLMVTALTGEGPLLTASETERIWKTVIQTYGAKVPVIPAIFPTTTADAIRMGHMAAEIGAAAVMVAPVMPELYGRRAQKHVRTVFETFCSQVSSLPVVLFNYPSVAGYDLTPELVETLSEIDNIRCIKESTGDSRRVSEILFLTRGRLQVICGSPEIALESLALGCKTWITAVTNVVPAACRALIDAMERGMLDKARELSRRIVRPLFELIRKSSNTIGTIKAGLWLRGINVGAPRAPGIPLEIKELREEFQRIFTAEAELAA